MKDEISVAEYFAAGLHSQVRIGLSTIEGVAGLVVV